MLCVCSVVPSVHLVLLVLGSGSKVYAYGGAWCPPGAASACCTWHILLAKVGCLGAHLMQKGSDPCKIPNLSHFLWSYRMHVLTRNEVNKALQASQPSGGHILKSNKHV